MKKVFIDGDMVAYRAAFASEYETKWDDDHWTLLCSERDMKWEVKTFFNNVRYKLDSDDLTPVFSPSSNYRYELFPEYKASRKGKRKPLGLKWLIGWMKESFGGITADNMEADDWIGILCTKEPKKTVAVSGDKDFGTLPIDWYNPLSDERKRTSKEDAANFHLIQTLAGDQADGYAGAKGVGLIGAKKLLDKKGYSWETVVEAYEKAGQTEEDALLNARLAYILQYKDYNKKTKEITLWEPWK